MSSTLTIAAETHAGIRKCSCFWCCSCWICAHSPLPAYTAPFGDLRNTYSSVQGDLRAVCEPELVLMHSYFFPGSMISQRLMARVFVRDARTTGREARRGETINGWNQGRSLQPFCCPLCVMEHRAVTASIADSCRHFVERCIVGNRGAEVTRIAAGVGQHERSKSDSHLGEPLILFLSSVVILTPPS